ncbi:MAG TPA: O-antigen ligase family protein [Xanthomarina sp.]|nr:O-antigen ligase family protein [Xanthomarina sp.]
MKIFKYFLLSIILLKLSSFGLTYFGTTVGSLLNSLLFSCLLVYYFLSTKPKLPLVFIVLGLVYFLISGLNYSGVLRDYFMDFIKYFIFILGVSSLTKDTSTNELSVFAFIGAMSVLVNAVIFSTPYGRYGGFYINPNDAGLVCLIAFSLTFYVEHIVLKLFLQLLLVTAGIMTLSRYFILILILVNLIAVISHKKNSLGLITGTIGIVVVLTLSSLFNLNTTRFVAFKSVFGNEEIETRTISEGSRSETWALYKDVILKNPVSGIGYKALHGEQISNYSNVKVNVGVHNTYLMAIGESGIITFLLFILIYISLIIRSVKHLKSNPEYACIAAVLTTYLLVSHNYFDNYFVLFTSVWLYQRVKKSPYSFDQIEEEEEFKPNNILNP